MNMHEILGALAFMSEQAHKEDSIYKTPEWLSTAQMGWALGEEPMEVEASDGVSEQKQVARFLAPEASKYIRKRWEAVNRSEQELSPAQLEAMDLDNIWGKWEMKRLRRYPVESSEWKKKRRSSGNRGTYQLFSKTPQGLKSDRRAQERWQAGR